MPNQATIKRWISHLCPTPTLAEDIAFDLSQDYPNLTPTQAKFRAIDKLRQWGPLHHQLMGDPPAPRQSPLTQELSEGLSELPPLLKQVIILRFYEGKTYAQIAAAQRTTRLQVKLKLCSALYQLKRSLKNV